MSNSDCLYGTPVLAESEPGMYLLIFSKINFFPHIFCDAPMVDSSFSIENWDAYEP